MSETIKIEMEMPKPPEGWRYTGEIRSPKCDDWYLNPHWIPRKASYNFSDSSHPILERIPWELKVGDQVWGCNNDGPYRYKFDHGMKTWVTFRTPEDAQKFYREVRALADRIRAESEVE